MSSAGIIKTLKESSEHLYKEKGSEFIARAFPVKSEPEVQSYLEEIRKKYFDATHHCYAFRLRDGSFRYSDAGEPGGTAGIRILNAIDHYDVKDILIIVTRYFGGVKLGIGSLGKAYYTSSELLLRESEFQEERPFNKVTIKCDFNFISLVHRALSNHLAIINKIDYGEGAVFESLVPVEETGKFGIELSGLSKGEIQFLTEQEIIYHKI